MYFYMTLSYWICCVITGTFIEEGNTNKLLLIFLAYLVVYNLFVKQSVNANFFSNINIRQTSFNI